MTHCLANYQLSCRYLPGKGKIWIATDRSNGKIVAQSKRRKIAAAIATRVYQNTHFGLLTK